MFEFLKNLWPPARADGVKNDTESRSIENPSTSEGDILHGDYLVSNRSKSSSGKNVNPETAKRFSAVYSAILIISESLAVLPNRLRRKTALGSEEAEDHPLYDLIGTEPNPFQTWFDFEVSLISAALAHGNGYALIDRDNTGKPIELMFLEPGECSVVYHKIGRDRHLFYSVNGELVAPYNVIHIKCLGSNGIEGKSPIFQHAETIGIALAAEEFGARFFGNGAHTTGAFTADGTVSDTAYKRLYKQIRERWAGLHNSHTPLLLESGLKFNRISIPPNEAQFIETRIYQVEEVARIYRVPLHKLQSLKQSTNNNIEQQDRDFTNDCLLPWGVRLEQEYKRKLLFRDEKRKMWFSKDFSQLLRADPVKRANYYQSRFNTASITPNEIREKEGENRIDNDALDLTFLQSGFVAATMENVNKPQQNAQNDPNRANPDTTGSGRTAANQSG